MNAKNIILVICGVMLVQVCVYAQSVAIGTATPNSSVQLDISSTAVYNYKVTPVKLAEVRSSSIQPATKFYLYKKE
ncbi:MAG: hypothetical protein V4722_02775 [Bacteroidota bacterium]